MDKLEIPEADFASIDALRDLIRTGVMAFPHLERSPLIDLPIVLFHAGPEASATKRAHVFIKILKLVIDRRLEGKEAQIAILLFGFEGSAGMSLQERYRAVAKLYNPHWTWESYRKEPLTRQLLTIYLALKRETELTNDPVSLEHLPKQAKTNKVLIVQNIAREGPGLIEALLKDVAIDYDLVYLDKGEIFPDPTNYGALVVMGGPDSANDNTAKMSAELRQVKAALDAGVPYLGICLGLQVAVKVSGGKVVKGVKEIGLSDSKGNPYSVTLTDVALTALGKKDPLFVGLRNDFRVFQLHGETVEMTKTMHLLATGSDCRNQIVKIRRKAYGIQSHFELTKEMLKEWLKADPDLNRLNEQKVLAEFEAMEEVYTITGLSLFRNFLHIAGLIG